MLNEATNKTPLRVLHVIPSLSPRRGGPSDAILGLCPELTRLGIESTIITTDDDVDRRMQVPLMEPVMHEGCRVVFFPRKEGWSRLLRDFSYSPDLGEWLREHLKEYDLLHAHALFSYAPSRAMQLARDQSVPYLCRPLGLLGDWALQQKPMRKRAFLRLVDQENLRHAAAIEYSSPQEQDEASSLGLPTDGKVIPLGFRPVPRIDDARNRFCEHHQLDPRRTNILFLSRIHQKKGLDLLVDACARLPKDQFNLLIAGAGEPDYEATIKRRIKRAGIVQQTTWLGFVEGDRKNEALGAADLFVLPSHSESFGIAVAEAMSAGCGIVVTNKVPVSDWVAEAHAGWIIEPTVDSVHAALVDAIEQPDEQRSRGRRAVEASANLTYTVTAERLKDLYQSIVDHPVERVGVSDNLRILHVIPSMSQSQGGPSYAMPLMAAALAQEGVHVDIVTTDDDGKSLHRTDVPLGIPIEKDGYHVIHFSKQTEFYKTSLPLLQWLRANVRGYDLVHIHALFSFSSMAAMVAAREHGIPYVIRPLGVLNAWGMTQRRRFSKQASFALLDKPLINGAAAMHYTSAQERDDAARLHLAPRPEIVPLGVDLRGFNTMPDGTEFVARFPELKDKPFVLFLSRIDPKKGLDLLIPAFASSTASRTTMLVIAGGGDAAYAAKLRTAVAQAGLTDRVVWTGHLAGSLKLSALSAAALFVLPSHSENFGIALLEAMAAGCACISSPEVALAQDVAEDDAVEIVPRSIEDWSRALDRLMEDAPQRAKLAANARKIAHQRYSLQAMGTALHDLYERLLHRGKAAIH